jgi:hypothetical protein
LDAAQRTTGKSRKIINRVRINHIIQTCLLLLP